MRNRSTPRQPKPGADVTELAPWRSIRRTARRARGWGWPGAVGLLLLVMAAVLWLGWLPALRDESASLKASAGAAERAAARMTSTRQNALLQTPEPPRFAHRFPPAATRQARLGALWALAAEHGLDAKRSELRLIPQRELGLLRYSVNMPLSGTYAALRAFVEDAQRRDPALSVDRLRLRRASAEAAAIDADLTWSLYMKTEAELPAP